MFKNVLVLFILLISFAGCKKKANPPGYFFSFEIGGTKYSFDGLTVSTFSGNSGFQVNDTVPRYYSVSVMCFINASTGYTGVYTRDTANKRELAEFAFVNYISTDANRGQFHLSEHPFTFSITEQTGTYIAGNFEGTLEGGGWVTISNGQFRIPFKH